jgi:hypothetical protein
VVIDHDLSNFNIVEYEKDEGRIKYDAQMIQAKLKRLENNAELNRINMVKIIINSSSGPELKNTLIVKTALS